MEARWLAYIGSGLLAALSLAPSTLLTSRSQRPAPPPEHAATTDEPVQALVDVERQTARLRRYLTDAPTPREPARNPFRYGARPAPAGGGGTGHRPARPSAVAGDEAPPTHEEVQRPAPPQLRLIGMTEQAEGDATVRTAVISAFGNVHLVRVGDRIADRYEVTAVGADAVEVLDTATQQVIRLGLKP